jgi:hypothetical protein
MKTFWNFILEKRDPKEIIAKFFPYPNIIEAAYNLSPKLSFWICSSLKQYVEEYETKNYPAVKKAMDQQDQTSPIIIKGNNEVYFRYWKELKDKYIAIVDWSKSPDISFEDKKGLPKMKFEEAYKKAEE